MLPYLQQVIDRFWETIPSIWRIVRGHVRAVAVQNFEISVEQFHILRHIRKGTVCASDLARTLGLSRPAISQAVETLVSKGLLTRTPQVGDRRFIRLELTAKGTTMLDAIFGQTRQWMAEKMASLTAPELQTLMRAMDILYATFAEEQI